VKRKIVERREKVAAKKKRTALKNVFQSEEANSFGILISKRY
jgi:hypothetical protein